MQTGAFQPMRKTSDLQQSVHSDYFNPLSETLGKLVLTNHWKAVEQYCTVVLFVFQFYPVGNFEKLIICFSWVKGSIKEALSYEFIVTLTIICNRNH